jgi:acido-empty-quinoprotein group A
MKRCPLAVLFLLAPALSHAQLLDPQKLLEAPTDSWPTYNGDYSGRRHSSLTQINAGNISSLSLAWFFRLPNLTLRGVGTPEIKSTPLMVGGILFFTIPDHVFSVDARTGKQVWHYEWHDQGGHLVGNRGVGIYRDWLYFLAPDGWLICLNTKDGKERWRKKVADEKLQYFTTAAPVIVSDHVIVGVGGDAMDVPGFLEARDPETGDVQWRWNSEPSATDPEAKTWPNETARLHGGGMTWLPGTYDPELKLLYWGTGNPNPVYAGQGREGDNLWTCSIVALHIETGKLAWYFQASPHDTHDWDNVETPVLIDATINNEPRKLLAQAARNGYFFVLDRTNGKSIVSKPFIPLNWSQGIDSHGQPIPNPKKNPTPDGSLLSIPAGGATNWPPPSFDPETGLFFVQATRGYSLAYLTDTDERPEGYGGSGRNLWSQHELEAIKLDSGEIAWSHPFPNQTGAFGLGGAGILTTAGQLLFTGDFAGNFVAFAPRSGNILWHFPVVKTVSNGPETYLLDGRQYVVAGAGDTLFAFALAPAR